MKLKYKKLCNKAISLLLIYILAFSYAFGGFELNAEAASQASTGGNLGVNIPTNGAHMIHDVNIAYLMHVSTVRYDGPGGFKNSNGNPVENTYEQALLFFHNQQKVVGSEYWDLSSKSYYENSVLVGINASRIFYDECEEPVEVKYGACNLRLPAPTNEYGWHDKSLYGGVEAMSDRSDYTNYLKRYKSKWQEVIDADISGGMHAACNKIDEWFDYWEDGNNYSFGTSMAVIFLRYFNSVSSLGTTDNTKTNLISKDFYDKIAVYSDYLFIKYFEEISNTECGWSPEAQKYVVTRRAKENPNPMSDYSKAFKESLNYDGAGAYFFVEITAINYLAGGGMRDYAKYEELVKKWKSEGSIVDNELNRLALANDNYNRLRDLVFSDEQWQQIINECGMEWFSIVAPWPVLVGLYSDTQVTAQVCEEWMKSARTHNSSGSVNFGTYVDGLWKDINDACAHYNKNYFENSRQAADWLECLGAILPGAGKVYYKNNTYKDAVLGTLPKDNFGLTRSSIGGASITENTFVAPYYLQGTVKSVKDISETVKDKVSVNGVYGFGYITMAHSPEPPNIYIEAKPKGAQLSNGTVRGEAYISLRNHTEEFVYFLNKMQALKQQGAEVTVKWMVQAEPPSATSCSAVAGGLVIENATLGSIANKGVAVGDFSSTDPIRQLLFNSHMGDTDSLKGSPIIHVYQDLKVSNVSGTLGTSSLSLKFKTSLTVTMGGKEYKFSPAGVSKDGYFACDTCSWSSGEKWTKSYPENGDARVFAEVRANECGNEDFDILSGMPSTENVYVDCGAQKFIVDMEGTYNTGAVPDRTIKITATFKEYYGDNRLSTLSCNGHSYDGSPIASGGTKADNVYTIGYNTGTHASQYDPPSTAHSKGSLSGAGSPGTIDTITYDNTKFVISDETRTINNGSVKIEFTYQCKACGQKYHAEHSAGCTDVEGQSGCDESCVTIDPVTGEKSDPCGQEEITGSCTATKGTWTDSHDCSWKLEKPLCSKYHNEGIDLFTHGPDYCGPGAKAYYTDTGSCEDTEDGCVDKGGSTYPLNKYAQNYAYKLTLRYGDNNTKEDSLNGGPAGATVVNVGAGSSSADGAGGGSDTLSGSAGVVTVELNKTDIIDSGYTVGRGCTPSDVVNMLHPVSKSETYVITEKVNGKVAYLDLTSYGIYGLTSVAVTDIDNALINNSAIGQSVGSSGSYRVYDITGGIPGNEGVTKDSNKGLGRIYYQQFNHAKGGEYLDWISNNKAVVTTSGDNGSYWLGNANITITIPFHHYYYYLDVLLNEKGTGCYRYDYTNTFEELVSNKNKINTLNFSDKPLDDDYIGFDDTGCKRTAAWLSYGWNTEKPTGSSAKTVGLKGTGAVSSALSEANSQFEWYKKYASPTQKDKIKALLQKGYDGDVAWGSSSALKWLTDRLGHNPTELYSIQPWYDLIASDSAEHLSSTLKFIINCWLLDNHIGISGASSVSSTDGQKYSINVLSDMLEVGTKDFDAGTGKYQYYYQTLLGGAYKADEGVCLFGTPINPLTNTMSVTVTHSLGVNPIVPPNASQLLSGDPAYSLVKIDGSNESMLSYGNFSETVDTSLNRFDGLSGEGLLVDGSDPISILRNGAGVKKLDADNSVTLMADIGSGFAGTGEYLENSPATYKYYRGFKYDSVKNGGSSSNFTSKYYQNYHDYPAHCASTYATVYEGSGSDSPSLSNSLSNDGGTNIKRYNTELVLSDLRLYGDGSVRNDAGVPYSNVPPNKTYYDPIEVTFNYTPLTNSSISAGGSIVNRGTIQEKCTTNPIVIHNPITTEFCKILSVGETDPGKDCRIDNVPDYNLDGTVNHNKPDYILLGNEFEIFWSDIGFFNDSSYERTNENCSMVLPSLSYNNSNNAFSMNPSINTTTTKYNIGYADWINLASVNSGNKGYTKYMNTSLFVKNRYVTFPFAVSYDDWSTGSAVRKSVAPNTKIKLESLAGKATIREVKSAYGDVATVPGYTFKFFLSTSVREAKESEIKFEAEAVNDGSSVSLGASNKQVNLPHEAPKVATNVQSVEIVGRIGNLMLEDTGDPRYGETTKKALASGEWLIQGLVHKVDLNSPNYVFGSKRDILMNNTLGTEILWNSMSTLKTVESIDKDHGLALPLSPNKNVLPYYKEDPIKLGYNLYMDIQTIGNYWSQATQDDDSMNPYYVDIIPKYFLLNTENGAFTPVDIYATDGNKRVPIYSFNGLEGTADYSITMNLMEELGRRNISLIEKKLTEAITNSEAKKALYAAKNNFSIDNYDYIGTANKLRLDWDNLTFMGSSIVYSDVESSLLTNVDSRFPMIKQAVYSGAFNVDRMFGKVNSSLDEYDFIDAGQRYHFTIGLPSTSYVVKAQTGYLETNQVEIERLHNEILPNGDENNKYVIVCAIDVVAKGTVWTLRNFADKVEGYNISSGSTIAPTFTVYGNGATAKSYSLPNEYKSYQVVAIFDAIDTSNKDLSIIGTH